MNFFKITLIVVASFFASVVYAQTPVVDTLDATNRDVAEARLQGTVNFSGAIEFGQAFFEYGRTDLYGSTTPQRQITSSGDFNEKVTGLNEDTGYHFRAVVIASNGDLIFGDDETFITKRESDPSQDPPVDTTNPNDPTDSTGSQDDPTDTSNNQDADDPGVPPLEAPQDGESYTDRNGNNCLGSSAQPEYQVPGRSDTAIVGYSCPTQENTNSDATGVEVGPIAVGGSLIPNGTAGDTGSLGRPEFEDPGTDGIVQCEKGENNCDFNDAIGLVQGIINWIVGISVIFATALIAASGVMYMTSGGSGPQLTKAKGFLRNGLIGLFFIMFGWLIVNTALGILTPENGGDDKIGQDQTREFLKN